jgi:hypothetical protein
MQYSKNRKTRKNTGENNPEERDIIREHSMNELQQEFLSLTPMMWYMGVTLIALSVCVCISLCTELIIAMRKKMRKERYHARMKEMRAQRKPNAYGPPPSPEELSAQWDKAHGSLQEMLRFGEMLSDLEASDLIDNSPILNYDTPDGIPVIVARNPGLKGWLAKHCPHIGYKTAMSYKSLAQKARRIPEQTAQYIQQSPHIRDLRENIYKELKISHYELECPRKPRARSEYSAMRYGSGRHAAGRGRKRKPLIESLQSKTQEAMQDMTPEQRRQFADALLAFAKDIYITA